MYFPYGCLKHVKVDSTVIGISLTDNLVSAITSNAIYIFDFVPIACLASVSRSPKSVDELGANSLHCWSSDGNKIATATSRGTVIIYQIDVENSDPVPANLGIQPLLSECCPTVQISQISIVSSSSHISQMCCLFGQLCISSNDGVVKLLEWSSGLLLKNQNRQISDIPFAYDLHPSRALTLGKDVYVRSMVYARELNGALVILSDGRTGVLISESDSVFDFNQVQGVFAQNVNNATALCFNRRFRQITVCTNDGGVLSFIVNELTNELFLVNKFSLDSGFDSSEGKLHGKQISCSSDGFALCILTSSRTVHLYSVYGTLLFKSPYKISSCQLSPNGYQLWATQVNSGALTVQTLLKSCHAVNSVMGNDHFLVLQTGDRVFVSSSRDFDSIDSVKCWKVAMAPVNYLTCNGVISTVALDMSGNQLAVAAKHGVALYNFETLRWKVFGNESQEREISVRGGMVWTGEFVLFSCRNNDSKRFELRAYSRLKNLDNAFKSSTAVDAEIVVLNVYNNNLLATLDVNSVLTISQIVPNRSKPEFINISKIQETPLHIYVPYPRTVLSLLLSDVAHNIPIGTEEIKPRSLLMNVAGRVAIFQRDQAVTDLDIPEQVPLCTPSVIASNVEFFVLYTCAADKIAAEYFSGSLWLNCGSAGVRCWLPIPVTEHERASGSGSKLAFKRSMFLFHFSNYPLVFACCSGFTLGVNADDVPGSGSESPSPTIFPQNEYYLIKTLEMFVPSLLEDLIRRNLNHHAMQLAQSFSVLPSFSHMLELMLHNVLEIEATASEPIPDPLLPGVISFIKEFRQFPEVLARCARKTEVALWGFLFTAAGSPAQFFRECLERQELAVAASYLIILQNLEPLSISKQHANCLVDTCLERKEWALARDVIRFLKSIVANEGDEISPKIALQTPLSMYSYPAPSGGSGRSRHSSLSHSNPPPTASGPQSQISSPIANSSYSFNKPMLSRTGSAESEVSSLDSKLQMLPPIPAEFQTPGSNLAQPDQTDMFYLSSLIARRARRLLINYEIHDVFHMAAYIEFNAASWLKRERNRAAKIEDFVRALEKLHHDFDWPYPVIQDHSKVSEVIRSSTISGSPTSSVVTLQEAEPIPIPTHRTFPGFSPPSLASGHSFQQLQLDLDSFSLEAISSGFTPDQSKLQEARLQLADLSNPELKSPPSEDTPWSDEVTNGGDSMANEQPDLELLIKQSANRGSAQNHELLTHVLHCMMESDCYEWAILLCMMLSDVTKAITILNNVIGSTSLTDVGQRIIEGLTSLDHWSSKQCMGYRLFLAALFPYVQVLRTVMNFSFKTQKRRSVPSVHGDQQERPNSSGGLLMPASSISNSSGFVSATPDSSRRALSADYASEDEDEDERDREFRSLPVVSPNNVSEYDNQGRCSIS